MVGRRALPGLGGAQRLVGVLRAHLRQAQHRVQRRADLVAHAGQEVAFGLAGGLGLFFGQLDLGDVEDHGEKSLDLAIDHVRHQLHLSMLHALATGAVQDALKPLRLAAQCAFDVVAVLAEDLLTNHLAQVLAEEVLLGRAQPVQVSAVVEACANRPASHGCVPQKDKCRR